MPEEYKVYFYQDDLGRKPAKEHLKSIKKSDQLKLAQYVEMTRVRNGHIDAPFVHHVVGALAKLHFLGRTVVYYLVSGRRIVLLCAFSSRKMSNKCLKQAMNYYTDFLYHEEAYDYV
jgi:mRNA-degrading endonuclease RelE of RelBE toxin-antitoxin system